jgi:DNA-binding IclR family transcriptional regulator
MFLTPSSDLDPVDPDPALLAFIKCHITSLAKWEVLRVLAAHTGAWIGADQLVRTTHRPPPDIAQALEDLVSDGVVEAFQVTPTEHTSYRLPIEEPTSVVLHRLIDSATHSQELRAIIAAHLQHLRQRAGLSASTAAA